MKRHPATMHPTDIHNQYNLVLGSRVGSDPVNICIYSVCKNIAKLTFSLTIRRSTYDPQEVHGRMFMMSEKCHCYLHPIYPIKILSQ